VDYIQVVDIITDDADGIPSSILVEERPRRQYTSKSVVS
jgi:hypothetical protein